MRHPLSGRSADDISFNPNLHVKGDQLKTLTHKNIWSERQNNPELVIDDCKREFDFTPEQCDKMREILLRRGVNKWLLARRMFIHLKHEVTDLLRESPEDRFLVWLNSRMQGIAKIPRYVIFPETTTQNWSKIEPEIVVVGRKSRNWYDYHNGNLMKCPKK